MDQSNLNRRDFGKLTLAAFGGLLAGSFAGKTAFAAEASAGFRLGDKHICCGLNTCKGLGAGGKNECAGLGTCSNVEAHGCAGGNECAGQGQDGANSCKGKGSCAVPINGEAWKKVRASYETAMTKAGKKFGPAPASCGKEG
ncbi:MAG TPA: hypothetical protein VGS22_20750 [Thermoanaerobaculia bacterium]|jgi:hypothetical protein|nr:hypothetical protein [Thermoanaerobaculia bacterium]